jgi:hypothetical protein
MLLPSTDRSFETFWRQAARWIAGPSPDQVAITLPDNASPGDLQVAVDVRSSEFAAVGDAVVSATVTSPDGETRSPQWRPSANGRYVAHVQADTPGLYHINVDARRGRVTLGTSERWVYVGGVDREFAQPRLNTAWLMRVARASGGRYVAAADAPRIAGWLKDTTSRDAAPERREIWHEPWVFALFLALLSAEWILRRRWGLR